MRGVIIAGGTGSRLYPSTQVINKHLLPVWNKPMIYYPIETLKNSGITDILIVTNKDHLGTFMELLGSGRSLGVNFTYRVQDGSSGIADALALAEGFAGGKSLAVILGDNIFEDTFAEVALAFKYGARIFVKHTDEPSNFGVAELTDSGEVRHLEEKPLVPRSSLAVTGFYLYDAEVFNIIRGLKPSERGELEITDVNRAYLAKNQLSAEILRGHWVDAGTHESLLLAGKVVEQDFSEPRPVTTKSVSDPNFAPKTSPTVMAGILTYNSEGYVVDCLESLMKQDYSQLKVRVLDNGSTDQTVSIIKERFPEVELVESSENKGFAGGHNQLIRSSESDFYACLNIDMIFEPNFISELVRSISQKKNLGAAAGKIKFWDFARREQHQGKTNFIDSVGLRFRRSHRFEDIGQNEIDVGQYDNERTLFGFSGAAVLYRREALEDIAFTAENSDAPEYFDETMFMYKEDIDLAYRLQWAGWEAMYGPRAVSYHDRTASQIGTSRWKLLKNRTRKPARINRLSYLNHQLLLQKNWSARFSFSTWISTYWYNFQVLVYIILFETETLGQYWKLWRLRPQIKARRQAIKKRVPQSKIESFME